MFHRSACLIAALTLPLGCASPGEGPLDEASGTLGSIQAALDACSETVPDTRKIDGVPAYAQCTAIAQGAIFSNNGVDTSATKVASDWVQTQFSGGYQCTELAHRYLLFKWKVKWLPNGNAGEWCNSTPSASSGVVQTSTPVHGDLIVFAPSSCGADSVYGHVAVVDEVDAAKGKVTAVEQNMARRGSYNTTCGKCFLHVVANDGTNPGETIGGGATPAVDAGGKPVVDAGSAIKPPARDAAVDSGSRPSMIPVDSDEEEEEPAVESGKKTDAGARKDAGAKDAGTKDDEDEEQADDEVEEDPAPANAASEGCGVAHGSSGASTLLACLGALLARRRRPRP